MGLEDYTPPEQHGEQSYPEHSVSKVIKTLDN